MSWFTLPVLHADNKAAFDDSAAAVAWLGRQPLANAPVMQGEFARQIHLLNEFRMPPGERFRTLEVMRKVIFAVDGEAVRRFENRPLPLLAGEQMLLEGSCELWRGCAIAYLHCLRACLDGVPGLPEIRDVICHRALVCLRMEQTSCYLGGQELADDFWLLLHAVLASAEQLGVVQQAIADRLLGETQESTVGGQYVMAVMLQLAGPFDLTRSELGALKLWLARWREQAEIVATTDGNPKTRSVPLDLMLASPCMPADSIAAVPRWLLTGGVLRKIRHRLEALTAGETPETLKLGSGLSAEACTALLKKLAASLKHPSPAAPDGALVGQLAGVIVGLDAVYRQLGGKPLQQAPGTDARVDFRAAEQLAVFDHVVRTVDTSADMRPESWLVAPDSRSEVTLRRPAGQAGARVSNQCLLAVRLPGREKFALVAVRTLFVRNDGSLYLVASRLPGDPQAMAADVREKTTNRQSAQALLVLSAAAPESPASLIMPVGLPVRTASLSLRETPPRALRLLACLKRGADYERWTFAER